MSWTDDRIATLKKMWKDGKSAAEIAKALGKGVTRNAVIGKAHRMGLSGRPSPIKKSGAKKTKKETTTTTKKSATKAKSTASSTTTAAKTKKTAAKAPVAAPKRSKTAPAVDADGLLPHQIKEDLPPGGGVSLLELTEKMCKWPIGDPKEPDFVFCGQPSPPGMTYCPAHSAAAYQSSRRSQQAVAQVEDDEEEDVADDDAPEIVEDDD